jgi:hypothetical protein
LSVIRDYTHANKYGVVTAAKKYDKIAKIWRHNAAYIAWLGPESLNRQSEDARSGVRRDYDNS